MTDVKELNKKIRKLLEALNKRNKSLLTVEEKKLIAFYQEVLDYIRKKLSDMYLRYGDDVDFSTMAKYNRLGMIEKEIQSEMLSIYKQTGRLINEALKSTFTLNFLGVGDSFEKVFSTGFDFMLPSRETILAALENPLDRVTWLGRLKLHHEKALRQINSEIAQGLIQGRGYSKTARAVKNRVEGLTNNALRIVRTESHRVQTEGFLAGVKKSEGKIKKIGYKTIKVLISTLDDRTRLQSRIMHQQRADEDGMFTYPNGIKRPGPGMTGVPEYDINDREIVIVEFEKI